MASKSLGTIRVDLVAGTEKFDKNLQSSAGKVDKFGGAMSGAGAVIGKVWGGIGIAFSVAMKVIKVALIGVGAAIGTVVATLGAAYVGFRKLVDWIHETAEVVDDLGKKSRVLGISIERLSALKYAAGESGVEFEPLVKLIGKAEKNLAAFARNGAGPAAEAIQDLNLQVRDGSGHLKRAEVMLPEIAAALESIGDQGDKLRLAEQIFGKAGGQEFVQLLEDGGDFLANINEQTERAKRLGVVFSERQYLSMKAYADAVYRLEQSWLGVKVAIASEVAPVLTGFLDKMAERRGELATFARNFLSVARAVFDGFGMIQEGNANPFNAALQALKDFAAAGLEVIWTEVKTRVVYFGRLLWEVVRQVLVDIFGGVGKWIADAIEGAGGVGMGIFGGILNTVKDFAGFIVNTLKMSGDGWGNYFEAASTALRGVSGDMADQRKETRDWFGVQIRQIQRLGEKYRGLRGETDKTLEQIVGVGVLPKAATAWDNFFKGMQDGWRQLREETQDYRKLGEGVFNVVVRGFGEQLASALAKGEASFRNFGKVAMGVLVDVGQAVVQMILQFLLYRAIVGALGPWLGGPSQTTGNTPGAMPIPDLAGPYVPTRAAHGGVFSGVSGGGSILDTPTGFGFGAKVGVAGEGDTSEVGFAPLRTIGGELGVKSIPGDIVVQVIDQRSGGEKIQPQSSRGDDGRQLIRIIVRDEMKRAHADGGMDRTMQGNYGVRRIGVPRA